MLTEQDLQEIQRRVDNDWDQPGPIDGFYHFASVALDDRRRLLVEVQQLRGENKQFRSSVRQYAEYHAMILKGEEA